MNTQRRSVCAQSDPLGLGISLFPLLLTLMLMMGASAPTLAAESGKLLEKDGKYVFVESMDPSMHDHEYKY